MPDVHTIRLRRPWKCEPGDNGVRWIRSFNWPAGLTPREVARLVLADLPADGIVEVNGQPLPREDSGEYEITRLLDSRNRVAIEIPGGAPTDATDCPFDVRLEIVEG